MRRREKYDKPGLSKEDRERYDYFLHVHIGMLQVAKEDLGCKVEETCIAFQEVQSIEEKLNEHYNQKTIDEYREWMKSEDYPRKDNDDRRRKSKGNPTARP